MKGFWTVRRHAFAWITLACVASVYLWSLYQFPSLRQSGKEPAEIATRPVAPAPGKGKPASPLAGIAPATDPDPQAQITRFKGEIDALRRQVEELKEREAALRERVTALESAFGPNTAALPPDAPAHITAAPKDSKPLSAPVPKVTITRSPLPEDGFGDVLVDVSPLPVAGTKEPTKTLFGIELATADSAKDLSRRWAQLADRHKPLLGRLEARQEKAAAAGAKEAVRVRLIAGPFSNAAGAAQLCARLRAAGTACRETVFTGEALPPL